MRSWWTVPILIVPWALILLPLPAAGTAPLRTAPLADFISPANGEVIGGDRISFAWRAREGDTGYRFELSRGADLDPKQVLVDVGLTLPRVMIGPGLEPGLYSYRVTARGGGDPVEHRIGEVRHLQVVATDCAWFGPTVLASRYLADWLLSPSCPANRPCRLIDSIELKFQRKDSPLACMHPCCSASEWNRPHRFCTQVALPAATPAAVAWPPAAPVVLLCTGPRLAADCRPGFDPAEQVGGGHAHGRQNCLRASVSMIASAYRHPGGRVCLSQDRIAYQVPRDCPGCELAHDFPAMNCTLSASSTNECSFSLLWALDLPAQIPSEPTQHQVTIITSEDVLSQNGQAVPSLTQLMAWLDDGRPVMLRSQNDHIDDHIVVIAGYCLDPSSVECFGPDCTVSPWLAIYDPLTGPRLVRTTWTRWRNNFGGLWVAPPVSADIKPRQDEDEMWTDSDGDGLTDFDEQRFPNESPDGLLASRGCCPW